MQEAADSSVLLSWDAAPGASRYFLAWGLSSGNPDPSPELLWIWFSRRTLRVSVGSFSFSISVKKRGKWELEEGHEMSHLAFGKSLGEGKKEGWE